MVRIGCALALSTALAAHVARVSYVRASQYDADYALSCAAGDHLRPRMIRMSWPSVQSSYVRTARPEVRQHIAGADAKRRSALRSVEALFLAVVAQPVTVFSTADGKVV